MALIPLFIRILRHDSRISQNVGGAAQSRAHGDINIMSELVPVEADEQQDNGANTLAWFLTGAIIGATVAILYAPRSGSDTHLPLSICHRREPLS